MQFVLAGHMATFDPFKFSGAWYEVASYKAGFTPMSSVTCMDTRGIYEYDPDKDAFDVQLGCRHVDRHVTAIKALMRCGDKSCSVRYPSAPYVQPSLFRILATDYESWAIVEGADDKSFVQIFSRYARPGNKFIEAKTRMLRDWGYDPDQVHVTPVTVEPNVEL
jgi:lipocalin